MWNREAGDWARFQEDQTRDLIEQTLTALDVGAGTTVLDVGCGAGLGLALAQERGAVVSGVDASPALLELAAARLADGAEVKVGDLQKLPFQDDTFDVVMSYNAIRYATDAAAAIREFARVTVPGGQVGIGSWGEPRRCETTAFLFAVVALFPALPHGAHQGSANTPDEVRAAMTAVGLTPSITGEVDCPFVYEDFGTAWRALGSTELVQQAIALRGEETVREVFDAHLRPAVRADGTVRQENVFAYSVARVSPAP